jgi:CBS domain-containing protein
VLKPAIEQGECMRVSNLLTTKGRDVATISQERTVTDALHVLKERGIGALIVTGPTAPLVGIFSERDVVRALATRGEEALQAKVSELMSTDVTTCDESTTVTELMGLMTERHIRHVPVVEEGNLVGMISIGDVVKARFDELEHEKKDLLDYVSSW